MDELDVSTVVYLPPDEVYEFLVDFPRYGRYSKHLTEVRQHGDGGAGTRYDLTFSWWKLTYTAHSEVTAVDPPWRIDWRIVKNLDAHGYWLVEERERLPADAPDDAEAACDVHLVVEFDPQSARDGTLELPRFVSFDWVVGKVKPILLKEAQRVVERIVADIEGRRRHVELVVHEKP